MPQFFYLQPRTFFANSKVNAIDAAHFHGVAMRGRRFPCSQDYRIQFEVDNPLKLKKNVYSMAKVFCPCGEFVVSEEIAFEMHRKCQIKISPVTFEVKFSLNYRSMPMDRYDLSMQQIDRANNDPSIEIRDYFHVEIPPAREVKKKYSTLSAQKVRLVEGSRVKFESCLVSNELFHDVPIYASGGFIMDGPVFDILFSHLDLDYFVVGEGSY